MSILTVNIISIGSQSLVWSMLIVSNLEHGSVQTGVGFSPPRSDNLPFCHLGLLKGRFSSL